jgi:hypothetical protein
MRFDQVLPACEFLMVAANSLHTFSKNIEVFSTTRTSHILWSIFKLFTISGCTLEKELTEV